MADYIYLLQTRLTPAQWRAVEAVREAARARGVTVFLVGGAVRDLTTGAPVRDLDFAVQGGDAFALVSDLEAAGAFISGRNAVLSSTYLTMGGGVRAEIGPTQSVTYPRPGHAETRPSGILDDLRRRDFTANAMAISLNEGSYGLLLDPLNGIADIENRELRLVSNYGFIEQPALLLRAARLSSRLGWNLEERTEGRYQTAKQEGYISALPAADRGYELEEIFHEEDPLSVLEQMEAEGWRDALLPVLTAAGADRAAIDAVRDLVGQLEGQGIYPDPSAVYFPLLTGKLGEREVAGLKQLFARPGFVQQIESLEARGKVLAGQLTAKSSSQPSDTWRLLFAAEPDVVLWLAHSSRSGPVQSKLKGFLKDWPQMRQRIPYALMQEMRITPDLPGYDKLLDDLFFALIDGKLDTPEATRAFLEPFSPPAPPPQVNVRRRPAKASRGRSRKALEEVVAARPEDAEDEDVHPESKVDEDEPDTDHNEDEDTAVVAPAKSAPVRDAKGPDAIRASASGQEKPAAQKKGTSAVKGTAAKSAPAKATPTQSVAPAKTAPPAKKVPPPVKAAKPAVTKSVPLHKTTPPPKKVAAVAMKKPVKVAAKSKPAPAKKGGQKVAGKHVQPKASHQRPAPKKAARVQATKASAAKQPAKRTAGAPAKRSSPPKKAAVKSRKR